MKSELNDKEFQAKVLDGHGISIVQFKTEWSGACTMLEPIYEELKKTYSKAACFFTIDVEKEPELAADYRIQELPTMLFFRDGVACSKISGLVSRNVLVSEIESLIG